MCVFCRSEECYNLPYFSQTIENPTWLDVCRYANDSILHIDKNGIDHRFLERVERVGSLWFGKINIYEMFFGS